MRVVSGGVTVTTTLIPSSGRGLSPVTLGGKIRSSGRVR